MVVTYRLRGPELLLEYPVSVPYGPYSDTAVVDDDFVTVRVKVFGGPVSVREHRYQKS